MSNYTKQNPPAFPMPLVESAEFGVTRLDEHVGQDTAHCMGMTLRDYFAAKAMQSQIAALYRKDSAKAINDTATEYGMTLYQWVAISSYRFGDAMLAERAKEAQK